MEPTAIGLCLCVCIDHSDSKVAAGLAEDGDDDNESLRCSPLPPATSSFSSSFSTHCTFKLVAIFINLKRCHQRWNNQTSHITHWRDAKKETTAF